ncbi:MAG: PIN domain nuclease [Burkholderiales bacterium]|nr:PIN domain nuclease [Burkholderiales bacterium]
MIVVDASVWVDYFNGVSSQETDILEGILGQERVIVGDLTMTEVLSGFRLDGDFRKAHELLASCEYMDMVGQDVALEAARNYRILRRRGVTVRKTIDVVIGTFCIVNALPLLHRDRDFDPMEMHLGLRVWRA